MRIEGNDLPEKNILSCRKVGPAKSPPSTGFARRPILPGVRWDTQDVGSNGPAEWDHHTKPKPTT